MSLNTSAGLTGSISGGNLLLHDLLENAFCIPNYQRPYKWEQDQIEALLSDIDEALSTAPSDFYYLGTVVLVKKQENRPLPPPITPIANPETDASLEIYDILDGQQRLTTLGIIMAVLRDLGVAIPGRSNWLQHPGDYLKQIPKYDLLDYKVRHDTRIFWQNFIQTSGETLSNVPGGFAVNNAISCRTSDSDTSIANIAKAVEIIFKYFVNKSAGYRATLCMFLLQKTYVSCMSTGHFATAFRMFKVLNARGMPLTEPDIIKAENIACVVPCDQDNYARLWQDCQDNLKENFDEVFYILRNIGLKKRSQRSLVDDWRDIVSVAIPLGVRQLNYIFNNCDLYVDLFLERTRGGVLFSNLIIAFDEGFQTGNWMDPLLLVFMKFPTIDTTHPTELVRFAEVLYQKMLGDLIFLPPPIREANIYRLLGEISTCTTETNLPLLPSLSYSPYNKKEFTDKLEGAIYGHRWVKALLLYMEYHYHKPTKAPFTFRFATIEHILPQNPGPLSATLLPATPTPPGASVHWSSWYSQSDHDTWLHKLGNLALLDLKTNQRFKNKPFVDKLKAYALHPSPMFMTHKTLTTLPDFASSTLKNRHIEMLKTLSGIL